MCIISEGGTVQSMLILNRYNTLELEMLPQFKLLTVNANCVMKLLQCIRRAIKVSDSVFNGLKDIGKISYAFSVFNIVVFSRFSPLHCSWRHTKPSSVFSTHMGGKWAEKTVALWVPLWALANSPCVLCRLHWTPHNRYVFFL